MHLLCWSSQNWIFLYPHQENGEVPRNVLEVRGKSSFNTSFSNSCSNKNIVNKTSCWSGQTQIVKLEDHGLVSCCLLVLGDILSPCDAVFSRAEAHKCLWGATRRSPGLVAADSRAEEAVKVASWRVPAFSCICDMEFLQIYGGGFYSIIISRSLSLKGRE